jgi:hypothetical protein
MIVRVIDDNLLIPDSLQTLHSVREAPNATRFGTEKALEPLRRVNAA